MCDPAVGCLNDASQAGDLCDDFIECTLNMCDPLLFCIFPPTPEGTSCDDGLTCVVNDQCDGNGGCGGTQPLACDDPNACTTNSCDEANGRVHTAIARHRGNPRTPHSCPPPPGRLH